MSEPFIIAGRTLPPRSRSLVELTLPPLYTQAPLTLPVHVLRGAREGPCLFVSAALHGDELNGTEIIRRILKLNTLRHLRGTLLLVPIVNVYGLIHHSRYLPDRRDLNRAFPGSEKGSMTARLASLFMREIVDKATHGIDLHTGAIHRTNLPQIRANLDDPETARLAEAFGVPVLINANARDGSLRQAATEQGIPTLLYEAGEALRFNEVGIRAGVRGIVRVMRAIGMLAKSKADKPPAPPFVARSSSWVRANTSGLFRKVVPLGTRVKRDDLLGVIDDPFSGQETEVRATFSGIVIGRTEIPLVHEGEALFHIARFEHSKEVAQQLDSFHLALAPAAEGDPEQDDEDENPPII